MRVLAFAANDGAAVTGTGVPTAITGVARVDVVSDPAFGSGLGRLMSAHHVRGTPGYPARPFVGRRLENAVRNPWPADVLVAASPAARHALPAAIREGLPWVFVLTAWRLLEPMVPSGLLQVCWDRGEDALLPWPVRGATEREAWFVALALQRLLHHAPPDELVALSRERH